MKRQFSERMGLSRPKSLQIDSMDDDLRNSLWNGFFGMFGNPYIDMGAWSQAATVVAMGFSKTPADEVKIFFEPHKWLKEKFSDLEWYQVYNLVEFLAERYRPIVDPSAYGAKIADIYGYFNGILEREMSGYRFVAGQLVRITNPTEIQSVNEATVTAFHVGLEGVHQHLLASLALLGKKPEPDYRNSIKEAISAVESVAKQIARKDNATLGPALDELNKHVEMHGGLKDALKKLYGYTSDEHGIRHAILEERNIGFDEAKFMLVACSAFVNFLISKADKAGLLIKA